MLKTQGILPLWIPATEAVSTVMCTLIQTLAEETARDLFLALPEYIRFLLRNCDMPGKRPHFVDLEEFTCQVAGALKLTPEDVEKIARAVFSAVKRHLSEKEVYELTSQVPGDLKVLWEIS